MICCDVSQSFAASVPFVKHGRPAAATYIDITGRTQYTRQGEHTFTWRVGGIPAAEMSEEHCFIAGSNDEGRRLDRLIRKMFPEAGLSRIYRSIRRGDIRLNQKRAAAHIRIRSGDCISVRRGSDLRTAAGQPAPYEDDTARTLPSAWIVFENPHILALNKPRGVLTHGPASLEEMVTARSRHDRDDSLAFRPGPLQRLDRNTTGLILFSRSLLGARRISDLMRERKISKTYLALLDGVLTSEQVWTDRLMRDTVSGISRAAPDGAAGHTALTVVTPLASSGTVTLAACRLVTGRTHQIRVQAALHGHPLAGDRKYGGSHLRRGYILHALLLRLEQEDRELGFHSLLAPLPEASRRQIDLLLGRGAAAAALLRLPGRETV
jgi:23S rRNA pseudouridine955/2504/2580 synthase